MRRSVIFLVGLLFLLSLKCYAEETGLIFGDKDLPPVYSKDYGKEVSKPPATLKEKVEEPAKAKPAPSSSLEIEEPSFEHLVRRGETLSGIAERFYTSVARIKEINNLQGSLILVGQKLLIPGKRPEIREPIPAKMSRGEQKKAPTVEDVLSSKEGKELLNLQTNIALKKKNNELTQLEVDSLKMELEKKKLNDEIKGRGITTPTEKSGEARPGSPFIPPGMGQTYIPPSGVGLSQPATEEQKGFRVLMISSYSDGKRALVRDEDRTFYVKCGDKVSKGEVEDITSSGLLIKLGEKTKLYPVSL